MDIQMMILTSFQRTFPNIALCDDISRYVLVVLHFFLWHVKKPVQADKSVRTKKAKREEKSREWKKKKRRQRKKLRKIDYKKII